MDSYHRPTDETEAKVRLAHPQLTCPLLWVAPEIPLGQYDKPANIFTAGLIVLEIACKVFLLDNNRLGRLCEAATCRLSQA